jgi:hypothetical protein
MKFSVYDSNHPAKHSDDEETIGIKDALKILSKDLQKTKVEVENHIEIFNSVIRQAKDAGYYFYSEVEREFEGNKVIFHCVGNNASHYFYIGLLNKNLIIYTIGDGFNKETNEFITVEKFYRYEEKNAPYYLGHF